MGGYTKIGGALAGAILATAAVCAALPAAATTVSVPEQAKVITRSPRVDPDLIRAIGIQAVQGDDKGQRKFVPDSVTLGKVEATGFTDALVKGTILEGDGLLLNSSRVTVTKVQYRVRVNLSTGEATATRIDEDAARRVALEALASMFIDMRPTEITPERITYTSNVSDQTCNVDLVADAADAATHWRVRGLTCIPRLKGR
ncbi:hypothetical protein [Burkholderia sp. Ac-20365]|uniref:hypothetical protein n=1 Tax=Burkholderia sp. Ac-20365 TaxID=2703897 RepID=UPI00197B60D1|nr:hypothetical protein [Burkholderia sp. Ac-20365]MBN3761278.1 hypothetical protein [Burkholderia sp. Ac-20365]